MPAKLKYSLFFLCAGTFFLSAAYLDLALRTRSAYLEGEKYSAWAKDPALKNDYFEKIFSAGTASLKNESGPEDRKALLLSEKNFKTRESAAKYAYIWYTTAGADFSPPSTRWTGVARQKAPVALELWEAELGKKGLKLSGAGDK